MRHALITAGTKGLGKKTAEHFLELGYSVTVSYRSDAESAQRLLDAYKNSSDQIHIVKADVTLKDDLINMTNEALERFGRIDCLINNAGPYIFERKKLADTADEEWHQMVDGNLSAVYYLLKQVIPVMRKQKFGRIITYGYQEAGQAAGWLNRGAFSAAKAGLAALTRTVAIEEAENGITANMICPGNIAGEMKEASISDARKSRENSTPIGRSGTGEDIARFIGFLCGENSDMVTGTVTDITGAANVIHRFRQ
ncbi:SDR family oxidoreductase [Metabacillus sp. GX 13764]|uniref:SDR family oxidoreductase n=1 Tax=Metabacillus kandeliae TaxID=2900151 RepID=UPI001E2ED671|nr:SDR family oxidoreductase [Metabacillus kandeliae]MCD7032780.1 SDR family oxidoreductase [Metabacillus kandeliae]